MFAYDLVHDNFGPIQILNPLSIFDIITIAFVRLFGVGFCAANPPNPSGQPYPRCRHCTRAFFVSSWRILAHVSFDLWKHYGNTIESLPSGHKQSNNTLCPFYSNPS